MANPYFNASYYLANNLDVLAAGYTVETAESHYLQFGAAEALAGTNTARKPAPWFDIQYYITSNPDLLANGVTVQTAFQHFTQYGINEGRSPSNGINLTTAKLSAYATANPDLVTAFGIVDPAKLTDAEADALANHYYAYGYNETRPAKPAETDVNPGQTFTLTTTQDNITAAASDTVLGLVGTNATFTLGDSIKGAGTLKLTGDIATVNLATASISNVGVVEANIKAAGAPGAAGTVENAGTLNLNSVAFTKAVFEGVTGDEATTANSDTLTVNGANLSTRVVLKDITDVASTVNFVGATGAADVATVEIAGAKETDATAGNANNNVTVNNIETLNVDFTTAANTVRALSADVAKTVNITVGSGANTTLTAAAALTAATKLNIDATGNLTLGATANLANDAAITVTGSGNVNLGTLDTGKTANGNTVNAASFTGKLTVAGSTDTASITAGSGADNLTSAVNTTVIVAGDGNDYVSIGAVDYGAAGAKTVNGGAGRDTLNVTAAANLDAGLMANVTGFEVLDIRNAVDATDFNVDGFGFEEVTIGGALAGASTVSGITNQLLTITANTKGAGTGVVTYALKTNTANDALKVSIAGAFDGKGTTVTTDDANDLTVAGIVTAGIETVTIDSKTDAGNVAGVKNTLTSLNTNANKLVVTGDHALEITGFATNTTIKTIDASASKGLLMGEGVQTVTAVSITGSAFGDTLVIDAKSVGANTINAGKGGDIITLGTNAARDTLILNAGDSQIGYVDTNKDGAYAAGNDAEAFDVITGFLTGTDLVDLGAFNFTGQKASALANQTLAAADIVKLVNGTTASIANFFVDTGVTRGVAVVQNVDASTFGGAANSTVAFIDVDGNGSLEAASDMMIVLSGTAAVSLANFGF